MSDNNYNVDDILREIKERRAAQPASEGARATPATSKTAFVQPHESQYDLDALLRKYEAESAAPQPQSGDTLDFGMTKPPQPQSAPVSRDNIQTAAEAARRQAQSAQTAQPPRSAQTATVRRPEQAPVQSAAPAASDASAFSAVDTALDTATYAKPDDADQIALGDDEDWLFSQRITSDPKKSYKPDNYGDIAARLRRRLSRVRFGVVASLVCALLVVYLALAPAKGLFVPSFLAKDYGLYLWVQVGLVVISAVCCGDMVGAGMLSLLSRRSDNRSYTTLAVFASLLHGAYLAMRPEIFVANPTLSYLPIAAVMLLFSCLGELVDTNRRLASCAICADPKRGLNSGVIIHDMSLARRLTDNEIETTPVVAAMAEVEKLSDFERQSHTHSHTESVSRIVAPITAGASLVMAVVSYIFSRDIFVATCVFTAALCIASPMAAALASALPLSLTNKRIAQWGATYAGYEAAEAFASAEGVLVPCTDLFPDGTVTLHGMKVFNKMPIDQSILDTAGILCSCQSPLSAVFRGMVAGKNMLRAPDSLTVEDVLGLSAWIDGRRVLVGGRELMEKHNIAMPATDFDRKYTEGGKTLLFVSNAGQLAAMFILTYTSDRHIRRALALCASRSISVLVHTNDPNVNVSTLNKLYNLPEGLFRMVPTALCSRAIADRVENGVAPAELVYCGGPGSYVRAFAVARSYRGIITAEAVLVLLSVIIGFALVTFLAFTGAITTLSWLTIAEFHLFWLVLELFAALIKR